MGLLDRIFKPPRDKDGAGSSVPESSAFAESEAPAGETVARGAPRRELLQVVLRDTMRSHGIPSDWMDCRILPATSRKGRGIHVHFVVRKAHAQLLPHVLAFQNNFRQQLLQFEPRAGDWLLGLAWQFEGADAAQPQATPAPAALSAGPAGLAAALPLAATSGAAAPLAPASASAAAAAPEDDVQSDLQALFAIRDQALARRGKGEAKEEGAPSSGFEPTRPGGF